MHVVEVLEVVEAEQRHAEGSADAAGALQRTAQHPIPGAAVREPGETVGLRPLRDAPQELVALERGTGLGREELEERLALGRLTSGDDAPAGLDDGDDAPAPLDRLADHLLLPGEALTTPGRGPSPRAARGRRAARRAALGDGEARLQPAGEPLPGQERRRAEPRDAADHEGEHGAVGPLQVEGEQRQEPDHGERREPAEPTVPVEGAADPAPGRRSIPCSVGRAEAVLETSRRRCGTLLLV